jgi:hypothetical protein
MVINGRFADISVKQGGMVTEIKPQVPTYVGSKHLYDGWRMGSLKLFSGIKYENVFVLYDIEESIVEIKTGGITKRFLPNEIDVFQLYGDSEQILRKFTNTKDLNLAVPIVGYLEILEAGEISLFSRHLVETKKPDYVIALDVGSRSAKKYQVQHFFLEINGQVMKAPKHKKEFLALFPTITAKIQDFMAQDNLSVKKREDLIKIIQFINSLKI